MRVPERSCLPDTSTGKPSVVNTGQQQHEA
jgi:hypothetical protein